MKNDEKGITSADLEGLLSIMSEYCKHQCEHDKAIIERLDTIISLLRTPKYTPAKFELIGKANKATKKDYTTFLTDLAGATIDHGYDSNKISKMLYYLASTKGIISVGDVLNIPPRELTKVKGVWQKY